MTQVTITVAPANPLLLIGLHRPGKKLPDILASTAKSTTLDLPNGLYRLAISGTGLAAGSIVTATFAASNSIQNSAVVAPDTSITELIDFVVKGNKIL